MSAGRLAAPPALVDAPQLAGENDARARASAEPVPVDLTPETIVELANALAERTTRTTLRPDEAAARLGLSRDAYDEHVAPHLREIRVGMKLRLVRVAELERWATAHESRTLEDR